MNKGSNKKKKTLNNVIIPKSSINGVKERISEIWLVQIKRFF